MRTAVLEASGLTRVFGTRTAVHDLSLSVGAGEVLVLLLEGYNDINTTAWMSAINPAAAAIESMSREARGRGARVFIASLTPPRAGGRNSLQPEAVTALNSRLRTIASGESAVFVDLYQALVSNVTLYIGVDGLHPTEIGYQRIAETFFASIQANLENR